MTTVTNGKATELITFTRGTLATVTDSDGKIKWAPHNLLTHSEQFDGSGWTRGANITMTANAAVAPNGTTTADRYSTSGGGDLSANGLSQGLNIGVATVTGGVWLRSASNQTVQMRLLDGSTQIVNQSLSVTSTWTLFTISGANTAGNSTSLVIRPDGTNAISNLEIWGAHLYRSDLGGMQANASAYPMYNPSTPKNLLGYSEAYGSGTGWTFAGILAIGSGSIANATAAPNGSLTASLLVESTANSSHNIYRTFANAVSTTPYTWAAYVKPAGRSIVRFIAQATGVVYDVEYSLSGAGSTTNRSGTGTATITALADGWYRISATAAATGSGTGYWQLNLCNAANTTTYTGDGTSGIYLWGAQLSDSASLDAYVPVFGAAPSAAAYHGPRLDYDPVTLSARGLLVEEARTNLLQRSEDFNTTWVKANATVTVNAIAAPDGSTTADKIVEDATATIEHAVQQASTTSGAAHTFSVYLKAGERTWAFLRGVNSALGNVRAWFNLSTGAVGTVNAGGTATITAVGNGWYRCALTLSAPATASYEWRVSLSTGDGTVTYTGDGTSGVYAWGAQLEAGAFATSYIPTAASTVTRNADVASVGVSQFPYSATEGTLVVNAMLNGGASAAAAGDYYVSLSDGTIANSAHIVDVNASISQVVASSSATFNQSIGSRPAKGAVVKLALAYASNDANSAVNGTAGTTDTTVTLPPAASKLGIGIRADNAFPINGWIRQITYLPRRISNTDLTARTA